MRQIDYVNAPAGAGKTFAGVAYIRERIARGGKIILAQPISRLIAETVDQTFPSQGIAKSVIRLATRKSGS